VHFLALGLTYRYDKRKARQSEDEDRRKVLSTIRNELAVDLKRIEGFLASAGEYQALARKLNAANPTEPGHIALFPDIRLDRSAMDTAIFSGKLFLLDQPTFEALSEEYRRIDVVNGTSNELRAIARAPVTRDYIPMIANLRGTALGTVENLRKSIPELRELLE